jgi:hypothetical protein
MNVGQVMGIDHSPGVANGVEKERPLEELHPIEGEFIFCPRLVPLSILDGIEKITATAQIVSTVRIDSHRQMLLAYAGTSRHIHAVTFDDVSYLIERQVAGQPNINGEVSFGRDRANCVIRVAHDDLCLACYPTAVSAFFSSLTPTQTRFASLSVGSLVAFIWLVKTTGKMEVVEAFDARFFAD